MRAPRTRKFLTLFLLLSVSFQTVPVPLSFLAPGNIVGGLVPPAIPRRSAAVSDAESHERVVRGLRPTSFLPSVSDIRNFGLAVSVWILVTGCPGPSQTLPQPAPPFRSPNPTPPSPSQTAPPGGDRVVEIPLEFAALRVDFYGNTQGGSMKTAAAMFLRRNQGNLQDNWGNGVISIRDEFARLAGQGGGEHIRGIRFRTGGSGRIRVWLRTVRDAEAQNWMPYIGGETHQAGGEIFLGPELLAQTRDKGGPDAIIIDLVSGEAEVSDLRWMSSRPVQNTPAGAEPLPGPIPTFRPSEVRGREMELGRQLLEQINRLETPRPTPLDPRPFIEWMRRARHPGTGLLPSADGERLPDGTMPSWLYTTATAVKFLVQQGEMDFARQVADPVLGHQNADGSWYFGRDYRTGRVNSQDARGGDVAWMAMGLLDLYRVTGDARYLRSVLRAVDYLKPFQQLDRSHRRFGSFSGGRDGNGRLVWTSLENNVDIAALFTQLAQIEHADVDSLDLLARARLVMDWTVRPSARGGMWTGDHFLIGYSDLDGNPSTFDEPTDVQTWTLLALEATRDIHPYRAADYRNGLLWILPYLKSVSHNGATVYGFSVKPYDDIRSVDADLTMGYVQAARLAGFESLANFFDVEIRDLRDRRGFFPMMVGPDHLPWPHNLRLAHQTPNHWAFFTNPFVLDRARSHAGLRYRRLPEPATIEAKTRLIAPARGGSGFIAEGNLTLGKLVNGLVLRWTCFPSEIKTNIHRQEQIPEIVLEALDSIQRRVIALREKNNISPEEDAYLVDLARFSREWAAELRRDAAPGRENPWFKVIPFEGAVEDAKSFSLAFTLFSLDKKKKGEKKLDYLGLNMPFIRHLLALENGKELVEEVIFHELFHFVSPEITRGHEREIHQLARRVQVKMYDPGLISTPMPSSDDYTESNFRKAWWRALRKMEVEIEKILDEKKSRLNRAIVAYLNDPENADRLLYDREQNGKVRVDFPGRLRLPRMSELDQMTGNPIVFDAAL